MEHASTFAAFLDTAFSAWSGTVMLWFGVLMVGGALFFLLDGAVEREPGVVGPALTLGIVAGCAFYLAGRLG